MSKSNASKKSKTCKVCGKEIPSDSKRYKYCSQKCKWKFWNDKKERKTSKSYSKAKKAREKDLNKDEKQIILGTLLGDGYLCKTTNSYCLSLCQSYKQHNYLKWKKDKLSSIIHADLYHYEEGKYNQYHVKSISHPYLANIRKQLYKPKKQVTYDYLNKIESLGLAVWYMDDGSFNENSQSKQITLSTESFGEKGNEIISDWLLDKWNIPSTIIEYTQRKRGYSTSRKQQFRLTINKYPSLDFFEIIKEHIPKSMLYKLPNQFK